MKTGKIKFFNKEKGYGFLFDEKGKEIFFHISGVLDTNEIPMFKEGTEVTFDTEPSKKKGKGDNAIEVALA